MFLEKLNTLKIFCRRQHIILAEHILLLLDKVGGKGTMLTHTPVDACAYVAGLMSIYERKLSKSPEGGIYCES